MNDEQINTFLKVTEKGSFSKAEADSYTSKQALLKQVNHLEKEIGFPLFHRTRKGVELTEAGTAFAKGIRQIQNDKQILIDKCRQMADGNILRIGSVEHQVLLNRVTEAFTSLYPEIKIQRVVHPNHSGEWRVANHIMDVGETFAVDKPAVTDFTYTRLTSLPYYAAMRPQHPLSSHKQISIQKLADYPTYVIPLMIPSSYMEELKRIYQGTDHLIERMDVDNQVGIAYECFNSNAVFIEANPFALTVPDFVCLPLKEGWTREYGIIYQSPMSEPVRKYVELAVQIYGNQ